MCLGETWTEGVFTRPNFRVGVEGSEVLLKQVQL